jgi:hypothetical protein
MNDEEMLTQGLKALAAEMDQLEAPPDVELKVLEAFRARQVVTPIAARRWRARYWVAAAVAAMLLIAVSVVAFRFNRRIDDERNAVKQEQPQTAPKVDDKSINPQQLAGVQEQQPLAPIAKPKHVRHANIHRSQDTQLANHVNTEIATDFMPLTYMTPVNLQDGGQIVRVELPRSALANFGLPVNMDRYNEKVKADVLLGVDGMAHAIRFVH